MKKIILAAALLALPAFANNNQVLSYEAEVVSALNPRVAACAANQGHHADVVSSCQAGRVNARFVVVADADHCSHDQLVRFVNDRRVNVRVGRGLVRQVGLDGYNQTVVQCVEVVKVRGRVLRRRVVRRNRLFGVLAGRNARAVRVAVDGCR